MRACVAVVVGLAAVGCGLGGSGSSNPIREPQEVLLEEVSGLLRATEAPPTKLADVARAESAYPRAYQAIKAGEVVVLWGTPMMGEGEVAKGATGGVPVAYEKNAPTAGGWALFTNGEVKKVTAADIPAKGSKK